MEGNSGVPPEILILCSTIETKERAIRLLEWIRSIPDVQSRLGHEPALPAVCSLIASEQLGNTVVTESRALQWSRTKTTHFRRIIGDVQSLLAESRVHHRARKQQLTYQILADEFCQADALPYMLKVEEVFRKSPGNERWKLDSELVQAAIFFWTCRWFKIRTDEPIKNIQKECDIFSSDLRDIEDLLDTNCSSILPPSSTFPGIVTAASPPGVITPLSESSVVTPSQGLSAVTSLISVEELAGEFEVGDDAVGGMHFLEKHIKETDELRDLVDWDSTMGRCVIFYWTCSVLKIPSAKHITLRNQYNLSKKDFDKLLSALDLHRAELRKKLEAFYAGNPALHLLPQSTQWPATSPANLKPLTPTPAGFILEKGASPGRKNTKKGNAKRGRPPKPKSPPPLSTAPTSPQEASLSPLCEGPVLQRALIILRSFNARRLPASDADRIPSESLPALVALLACQQLGDRRMDESIALQASYLPLEEFKANLLDVRTLIDHCKSFERFTGQTGFDALALEHGLSMDALTSMLHVRQCLKESRCLSVGMDWNSPLVICSIFCWTCAILKVPDVKQTLLRSRSLASRREFDSMLQLLNNHCAAIRRQLENNSVSKTFWFAPPPSGVPTSRFTHRRRHPSFYGEQEIYLEDPDDRSPKHMKSETLSEYEEDLSDYYQSRIPRKPGRLSVNRKPSRQGDASASGIMEVDGEAEIYRPTVQFPPADWIPPKSIHAQLVEESASKCPTSESGESKRRHTRYNTLDYADLARNRFEVWKPEGEEVVKQLATYRHRVERLKMMYGSRWERDILRWRTGFPFE